MSEKILTNEISQQFIVDEDSDCFARNCCGINNMKLPRILSEEEDFELTSAADETPAIWYSCQKIDSALLNAQVF